MGRGRPPAGTWVLGTPGDVGKWRWDWEEPGGNPEGRGEGRVKQIPKQSKEAMFMKNWGEWYLSQLARNFHEVFIRLIQADVLVARKKMSAFSALRLERKAF